MSIQAAREKIAANHGAFATADPAFARSLDQRYDAIKAKGGSHPADYRRLQGEVHDWAVTHSEGKSYNRSAFEAASGWKDLLQAEIDLIVFGKATADFGGVGNGWVNAATGEEVKLIAPEEGVSSQRGRSTGPTVGELVNAMLFGTKSDAIRNSLSEGTDSAGGYSVPTHLLPQFIDRLRSKVQFIRAGAKTMMLDTLTTKIARLDTDPTAAWRAELGAINISDPAFSALTFVPKNLAVLVKASREVLMDSINISPMIEASIIGAMSTKLDYAAFFGAGTSNEPLGLANTSGIGAVSMGTNGATPASYDDLLDMAYTLELANAADPTAIVYHPRTARTYRKMKDTTNQPLEAPAPLDTLPKLTTTSFPINQTVGTATTVCSTALMGDFTEAILGLREGLNIQILNQTYAATGEIAFVAHIRADVGFVHPASFCALTGIKP